MQTVAIVIHLMIVATLIATVLLQKSEGGGLGVGGGAGFMSSRGTANLLTRTTAILAFFFFLTSLGLAWLASSDRKPASIIDSSPASQSQPAGAATPYQLVTSKFLMPSSISVGTSGSCTSRFAVVTASARMRPLVM